MFELHERKQNIIKMTIYQGALLALQYMEGDNKDDPKQALYTRRVRQLKSRNKYLHASTDLEKMTNELKQKFNNIKTAAKTLEQLDKSEKETQYERGDRMKTNFKHHTQLAQLEIRDEILNVNQKEKEKERNRLQW